jgi:galactokinase/galacturonokinase
MLKNLDQEIIKIAQQFAEQTGVPADVIRVVVSPYRICPIGAHCDHQGGPVLGMAISAYTLLAFTPAPNMELTLTSANYPGEVRINLKEPSTITDMGWSRYAHSAAQVFAEEIGETPRALIGHVTGSLPDGGLSSSASVILAYLTALAEVNGVEFEPRRLVQLALHAEKDFVGVRVGILDPATIIAARRGHLVAIDTRKTQWELLPCGASQKSYRFLIVFSGITRNLISTNFNSRIEECSSAARQLATLSSLSNVIGLHDLPETVFETYGDQLSPAEARRARHFFGERVRVTRGRSLWTQGDLEAFGQLMHESCESSIHNWEAGAPELIAIQTVLSQTPGVFGSRFSGAGWGGCCLALVDGDQAATVRRVVEKQLTRLPGLNAARVFFVSSEDGLRVVSAS